VAKWVSSEDYLCSVEDGESNNLMGLRVSDGVNSGEWGCVLLGPRENQIVRVGSSV